MSKPKSNNTESIFARARNLLHGRGREQSLPERLRIEGQHLGDLVTDRPIIILASGTIGGNLTAPAVLVQGIVHGSIATRELVVEPSGQVWGDVYASSVSVDPGGRIHGWLTTLDEGTVDLLRDGTIGVADLSTEQAQHDEPQARRQGTAQPGKAAASAETTLILRQLQADAATAIMARTELEAHFEARVAQAVDDKNQRKVAKPVPQQRERMRPDEGQQPPPVTLDRVRKLQLALARSLQRVKELEADLAYRKATDVEVKGGDTDDADHWGRVSKTVAAAQFTYYQGIVEARGERAARLQAELVERDLMLERLQQTLKSQTSELDELKRRAAARVNQLERELDRQRRLSLGDS